MNPCKASIYSLIHNKVDIDVLQASHKAAHDSPDGLFAIMVKQGSTETMYYVHKDYLGSITAITDATGNLVESLSYDPWGRRRNPNNWTDYNVTTTLFDRGYTGHEHLPHFGLINMNGRVYDPFLARFLSPDPFVQAPGYTQNYNRYSYAFNNPLKYTDPSGYYVFDPSADYARAHTYLDGSGGGGMPNPRSFAGNWYTMTTNPTASVANLNPGVANRSEAMNYYFLSSSAFNNHYGHGAFNAVYDVMKDPIAKAQWLSGQATLSMGIWVQSVHSVGTARWFGFSSSRNRLAGVEVINKFVKFNGTTGRVDGNNSFLNSLSDFNTWFGTGLFGAERTLTSTHTGRNIGYGLAYTPFARVTNFIKPLGYGTSAIGFLVGTYRFSVSDKSWGDYGQLGVSFLSSGLTISPYTAPFGIAIGTVDMFGGFNGFYNYLDNQEQFYNSTGGLILQINQYPVFIPITRP